jgi:hypothetical protein
MEPNFQVWIESTDQLEDWHKQLIIVAYERYQVDLEKSKEELAEYYGN